MPEPFTRDRIIEALERMPPGATLDDRNAFPQGGLVLLNGVADYDIVAGATPFDTVPAYGATSISVARVDEAYNYGDIAHAGTFGVTTSGGADSAFFGADSGAHASTALGEFGASAAFSNWNQGDRRSHIDLTGPISSESTQGDFEISSGEGMLDTDGTAALASSFSSARASIERTTGPDMFASASIDRGTYTYQSSYAPDTAVWADEDLSAGVRSRAALAPFALIDIRESAGSYWESSAGTIAATLGQARAIAGLSVAQPGYDAQFAIGNDDATYTGGYPGALVDNGSTATALGSFDLKFDPQWTLHASAAHGYVVQTFLGTFGAQAPAIPSVFDVVATSEATLEFDSLARVRASLTTLRSQDASGSASSSAGASLGWQVAPVLSLRTWLLETQSSTIGPRTVGSAWLTYTTPGLRVDAIWRRDLLDTQPDAHLDGSIGGPLGPRLGWFVSTERRNGTRATDVGIRF